MSSRILTKEKVKSQAKETTISIIYRKAEGFDYRSNCVFTVDPATARDLDDALHCEDLGDGLFEIGVHIADVSYFVEEGTELDKVGGEGKRNGNGIM